MHVLFGDLDLVILWAALSLALRYCTVHLAIAVRVLQPNLSGQPESAACAAALCKKPYALAEGGADAQA